MPAATALDGRVMARHARGIQHDVVVSRATDQRPAGNERIFMDLGGSNRGQACVEFIACAERAAGLSRRSLRDRGMRLVRGGLGQARLPKLPELSDVSGRAGEYRHHCRAVASVMYWFVG